MSFDGFDPAALACLAAMPGWSADDYADHKTMLVGGLTRPGAALMAEVAGRLDADLTVTARGSVSPLHRDLRFAKAATPRYKDHLLLTAWEGADKKTAPMFWIRVDADRVGFASGIGFTPDIRDRWREAIGGPPGEDLVERLAVLSRGDRRLDIAGAELKRVPAPYDTEHPRADLLRHTAFQVRWAESVPESVASPEFAGWCADRLTDLLPVHRWLCRHLT
jgi:uncharacterized protein (DUF2461 family)